MSSTSSRHENTWWGRFVAVTACTMALATPTSPISLNSLSKNSTTTSSLFRQTRHRRNGRFLEVHGPLDVGTAHYTLIERLAQRFETTSIPRNGHHLRQWVAEELVESVCVPDTTDHNLDQDFFDECQAVAYEASLKTYERHVYDHSHVNRTLEALNLHPSVEDVLRRVLDAMADLSSPSSSSLESWLGHAERHYRRMDSLDFEEEQRQQPQEDVDFDDFEIQRQMGLTMLAVGMQSARQWSEILSNPDHVFFRVPAGPNGLSYHSLRRSLEAIQEALSSLNHNQRRGRGLNDNLEEELTSSSLLFSDELSTTKNKGNNNANSLLFTMDNMEMIVDEPKEYHFEHPRGEALDDDDGNYQYQGSHSTTSHRRKQPLDMEFEIMPNENDVIYLDDFGVTEMVFGGTTSSNPQSSEDYIGNGYIEQPLLNTISGSVNSITTPTTATTTISKPSPTIVVAVPPSPTSETEEDLFTYQAVLATNAPTTAPTQSPTRAPQPYVAWPTTEAEAAASSRKVPTTIPTTVPSDSPSKSVAPSASPSKSVAPTRTLKPSARPSLPPVTLPIDQLIEFLAAFAQDQVDGFDFFAPIQDILAIIGAIGNDSVDFQIVLDQLPNIQDMILADMLGATTVFLFYLGKKVILHKLGKHKGGWWFGKKIVKFFRTFGLSIFAAVSASVFRFFDGISDAYISLLCVARGRPTPAPTISNKPIISPLPSKSSLPSARPI